MTLVFYWQEHDISYSCPVEKLFIIPIPEWLFTGNAASSCVLWVMVIETEAGLKVGKEPINVQLF